MTGQFIDSAVEGLNYSCGDLNGTTNSNGDFSCVTGATISFKIGEYMIGSAVAIQTMTPTTLHPADTKAQENTLRLLQTLDSDGNPANGITLDNNLVKLLKADSLAITSSNFESMATVLGGKVLVTASDAKAHFADSIFKIEKKFTQDYLDNIDFYTVYSNGEKNTLRFTNSIISVGENLTAPTAMPTPNDYTITSTGTIEGKYGNSYSSIGTITNKIIAVTDTYLDIKSSAGSITMEQRWFFNKSDAQAFSY